MNPLVAKIMTFGAVAGVAGILALSAGKSVLGVEMQGQTVGAAVTTDTATAVTDFTARKKRHYYSAAPFAFAPPRYYHAGANPNYGPGTAQMLQARRENRCVMDEGYGRWTACSNQ